MLQVTSFSVFSVFQGVILQQTRLTVNANSVSIRLTISLRALFLLP
jgi:hypothetical protein